MIKLCELKQPKEVKQAISRVLDGRHFVKGPLADEFGARWAERCGMKYGISVGSGAQALELAIEAVFIPGVNDDIITYSKDTFKAVPNAIKRAGYVSKAVDDSEKPLVFAHHLHDQYLDYTPALEDCSHVHGYKPKANTAIFSLFPTKILGACGEAGVIVTNSEYVRDYCLDQRSHGIGGSNMRMDEIQASILLAKLPYLDSYIEKRKNLVILYDGILGRYTEGQFHYAYCVPGSEELKQHMIKNGVECAFYYTPEFTALPLYPDLKEKEVYQICRTYNDFSNNR